MPAAKRQITQETFDAAVKENIDEFGMEAEEAVASAVEEFQLQGVDVAGIIKSANGTDVDSHPLADATRELQAAAESSAGANAAALLAAVQALLALLPDASSPQMAEALAVTARAGAVTALLQAATALAQCPDGGAAASTSHTSLRAATSLAQALAALLQSDRNQDGFEAGDGGRMLLQLLTAIQSRFSGGDADPFVAEAAAAAAAAATGHEDNKCLLVDSGLAAALLAALAARQPDEPNTAVVSGVCAMVTALCVSDDARPLDVPGGRVPGGRSFQNARTLAGKDGGAGVAALVPLLRAASAAGPAAGCAVAVSGALRSLAVNDEICQDVDESGGLATAAALLRARIAEPAVAAAAAALCRQLANRDACKDALAGEGVFELVCRAAALHAVDAAVLEQVVGLLVSLTLRHPDNATAAVEAGCVDAIVRAMAETGEAAGSKRTAGLQRQGCMAIRNICARSPELRPVVVAAGAEKVLRAAKEQFPASCGDVGSAALRDMGCDNYNS